MSLIETLPYKKNILLSSDIGTQEYNQQITLAKSICNSDLNDRYYIRLNIIKNGQIINQGYIYFYLNSNLNESKFIGIGVKEEFRNNGIASLLISSWIKFCLDEGFYNLKTNLKQKKPFILYLLKKYNFELADIDKYDISIKTIYICQKEGCFIKYLIFKDQQEEKRFRNSNVMKSDNYKIISFDDNVKILDKVILSEPYFLQNNEKAYQKSLQIYNKHRI